MAHAHGIPTWPPDIDTTETLKQSLKKHTGVNNRGILGSNESTMQGTNNSEIIQVNGQAVLGINNETMQGKNSKEPPPMTTNAYPIMIGGNNDQCVKGINTKTPTKQNITLETNPTTNTKAHSSIESSTNKTDSPPKTAKPDSTLTTDSGVQTSAKSSSTPIVRLTEEHKRRPKPKGKHKYPKLPPPTADTNTSTPKPVQKSEFITVTHGL